MGTFSAFQISKAILDFEENRESMGKVDREMPEEAEAEEAQVGTGLPTKLLYVRVTNTMKKGYT